MSNKYLFIPVTDLDKVDFDQLVITSKETLRYSVDGLKTFIEWNETEPSFLSQLSPLAEVLNAEQIGLVLSTSEWQSQETLPWNKITDPIAE